MRDVTAADIVDSRSERNRNSLSMGGICLQVRRRCVICSRPPGSYSTVAFP